jgi:hypothetical protein
MLSWAQRTARWTVKTLPFSFGRANGRTDGRDGAETAPAETPTAETLTTETASEETTPAETPSTETPSTETTPTETAPEGSPTAGTTPKETTLTVAEPVGQPPAQPESRGSRHRALHERAGAQPSRGRHAAPSKSRRTRTQDAD